MTNRADQSSRSRTRPRHAGILTAVTLLFTLILAACDQGTPTPTIVQPTATSQGTNVIEATPTSIAEGPAATMTTQPDGPIVAATPTTPGESAVTPETTDQTAACTLLNLNTVTEAELMATIPNFSSRMVREFMEYRPYVSIQQFRREIGKYVDAATVAEYEKYVYVPVQPNDSDAETLMQMPEVTEEIAQTLISGRPYASTEVFQEMLETWIPDDQVDEATCYLDIAP